LHNATFNELLRWLQGERTDDGRLARCSLAPCHRFPLERPSSRWELYHVVGRWMKVLAEEFGGSLTLGRAGLAGLPPHQKPARSGSGRGWSIYPPCPMAVPTTSAKWLEKRAVAHRCGTFVEERLPQHPCQAFVKEGAGTLADRRPHAQPGRGCKHHPPSRFLARLVE
jgi:hypothetical protein